MRFNNLTSLTEAKMTFSSMKNYEGSLHKQQSKNTWELKRRLES